MAENDISKIVGLIMQNPELVEKIRSLAESESDGGEAEHTEDTETSADVSVHTEPEAAVRPVGRRAELLRALKPYLSEERGRAIESMVSIADVLGMMRGR